MVTVSVVLKIILILLLSCKGVFLCIWGVCEYKLDLTFECLVYLGRDTRTSTQSRRLVRRKDASWSLNWPSGANLLAHKRHKYILCVPL